MLACLAAWQRIDLPFWKSLNISISEKSCNVKSRSRNNSGKIHSMDSFKHPRNISLTLFVAGPAIAGLILEFQFGSSLNLCMKSYLLNRTAIHNGMVAVSGVLFWSKSKLTSLSNWKNILSFPSAAIFPTKEAVCGWSGGKNQGKRFLHWMRMYLACSIFWQKIAQHNKVQWPPSAGKIRRVNEDR